MKKNSERTPKIAVVLVTAPNIKVARMLATSALKSRLAACANLLPAVESHYWWQGKLEKASEILLLFKTTQQNLGALEKLILAKHPYDTPEFLILPVDAGAEKYLRWVASSSRASAA